MVGTIEEAVAKARKMAARGGLMTSTIRRPRAPSPHSRGGGWGEGRGALKARPDA